MTQEQIYEINSKCPGDQGVFFQPSMIPVDIKEHVIYTRYSTGGYSGGSCYDTKARYHESDIPENKFEVLDLVLQELKPNITFLQYKKIDKMIHTNEETDREYYGNSTDWKVEYIILSELEEYINSL